LTAIKTEKLSKYFGQIKALNNLDLNVPENVVFGFLGPNGAGKSTTIKLLTGFSCPTSGQAWVAGEKVTGENLALQAKTGFLPDVPAFYDWMSGREFLNFVGETHGLKSKEIKQRSDELLKLVELKNAGGRRIGGYSRGMRQRLGIAQALVNRPKVLFLDEPTSALDPIGRKEILDLIAQLKHSSTVFMSTHILADVERVCDLVGIINKGNLITVSSVPDLQNKYARATYEIEFLEDAGVFINTLRGVSWLSNPQLVVENGHAIVRVKAEDTAIARKELPRLVGESGLTLTRYELVVPNLEDIFMQVINGRVS
jgi:ABC-2 type transport system ATP-binding protein